MDQHAKPSSSDRYIPHPLRYTHWATQRTLHLGLMSGRSRNCHDIWATGWGASRSSDNDTSQLGRRRLRRRYSSEPPPGCFTSALLPRVWDSGADRLQIIYPRMPLSQLDRPARRRCLSRTHITAFFDWERNFAPSFPSTLSPNLHPHARAAPS
ncbi:hypothetical protein VTI74DRAFT_7320 [Chaetomium olivicolor]